MKAEIIATGTEILLGQTLNTSTHYLTGKLSALGIEVDYHTTVGDNAERIEEVLRLGLKRADLIIVTGGLGSTKDDLTKNAVAKVLGLQMVLDTRSLEQIKGYFERRSTSMPEDTARQAYFPEHATILPNSVGTASGALIEQGNKLVVILPGPPGEMRPMFDDYVWPKLENLVDKNWDKMYTRELKVYGMEESEVERDLEELLNCPNPAITLLSKGGEVHIRMVARSKDRDQAETDLAETEARIRQVLGSRVFARDQEEMIDLVAAGLIKHQLTIATAESCTGGLLGAKLTEKAGSSAFYLGGVVSYANSVKQNLLGVREETLKSHGAVSPEVAKEMAEGIQVRTGADLALATTGIAGPGGGSKDKPVGLVYIGFAHDNRVEAQRFQFYGQRESVRELTVQAALNVVREYMLKLERRTSYT